MEKLLMHETNIWASIYRLVEKPTLSNKDEESKEGSSNFDFQEEVQNRMRRISTLIDKKPQGLVK